MTEYLKADNFEFPAILTIVEYKHGLPPVLRFEETSKVLSMPDTREKHLSAIHGKLKDSWPGKKVELRVVDISVLSKIYPTIDIYRPGHE